MHQHTARTDSGRPGAEPAEGGAEGYEAVQRLLRQAVIQGGLPGILAEVRDGDRRWFGTAGVADTRTGRKRSPQDRFRIGSITKTFVATVVLQLAAEGRLSLDDTAEQWLPGVVHGHHHDGAGVDIRMLLNHTSGIFNYTDDQQALNRYEAHPPESLVQIAMSHPPTFTPGSGWAYSNTNYVLAGMIVERATGRALAEEITERISRPFGLAGTYLPHGSDPTIRGPHSRHYTKLFRTDLGAPVHDATELDPSMFWAAGGMISTAGDLNRFFGALLGAGYCRRTGNATCSPPFPPATGFPTPPTASAFPRWDCPAGKRSGAWGVRSSDRGPTPTALAMATRWSPPTSTVTGATVAGTT